MSLFSDTLHLVPRTTDSTLACADVQGTFFWEIVDLPAMLRFTGDAPGDVCAHARSCFIQLVSKSTLQTFMDSFNEIAKSAFANDDQFYSQASVDRVALSLSEGLGRIVFAYRYCQELSRHAGPSEFPANKETCSH